MRAYEWHRRWAGLLQSIPALPDRTGSGKMRPQIEGRLWGDSVEEVCFEVLRRRESAVAIMFVSATSLQVAAIDAGTGISLASLRRFWAVAARWNSSRAPFGPRSRSRSSFRMHLRWANSISTFLR